MPRPTDWIDSIVGFSAATSSQSQVSLMTGVAPVNMRGMTLIRTIVSVSVFSITVAGAWGIQVASIAIGVASQEAFAASILPDPNVATDKPPRGWVYRTSQVVAQNGAGAPVSHDLRADIRGARKIENGELYVIMTNDPVAGTTFSIRMEGLIRTLYKL